jgi:hypothetical protein
MSKTCIWCLKPDSEATFINKAHTIPKSLGGQNFNKYVCDKCNSYFGETTPLNGYSIESALKETFCITRQRLLDSIKTKRQVGPFKSKFFDVKYRKDKPRLVVKQAFLLKPDFQRELCRNFKRGLIKMWFEEFDRQSNHTAGQNSKYEILRSFARYNTADLPVVYFQRSIGVFMTLKSEAETPVLLLNRMKYLYENEKFTEIEFLGHVFGFPTTDFTRAEFDSYLMNSIELKTQFFEHAIIIDKITDVDFTLQILNR